MTLPLLKSSTGEIVKFEAHYNGSYIVVSEPAAVITLHTNGIFGRAEGFIDDTILDSNEILHKNLLLFLLPEEALFLLQLDCLKLTDASDRQLTIAQAWQQFTLSNNQFIQNYMVYHYYRSRKWVVKAGLQFGGDFVLYKGDPKDYHSSYVVIIDVDQKITNDARLRCRRSMDLPKLLGINRMAEAAGKQVIIAKIKSQAINIDLEQPACMKDFEIEETLLGRLHNSI